MEEHTLYGGEVLLRFDPVKHLYTVKIGDEDWKRVYGTTSVLQVINKPAIVYWAVGKAITHIEEEWKPGVEYDEIQITEALKDAKSAHRKFLSKAADTGTFVHKWIEEWIKATKEGKKTASLPVNKKIRESIEQFLVWVETNNVKFILNEQIVYNREYNVAGKLDNTLTIDGEIERLNMDGSREMIEVKGLYLGDIKTSSGIYPEQGFQLSNYLESRTQEYPKEKYLGRIIVRIGKDGKFEPVLLGSSQEDDLSAFYGAHALFMRFEKEKDLKKQRSGR